MKLYDYLSELFPIHVAKDIVEQSQGEFYNLKKVVVNSRYQRKLNAILNINSCAQFNAKETISSSVQASRIFINLAHEYTEHFMIATLNRANKLIGVYKVGQGGVSQTPVDIRVILRHAVTDLACGIILCHNHPSGNALPSQADKTLTRSVIDAANALEIKVLDHIIIAKDKYYSFSDEGTLDN